MDDFTNNKMNGSTNDTTGLPEDEDDTDSENEVKQWNSLVLRKKLDLIGWMICGMVIEWVLYYVEETVVVVKMIPVLC